MKFQGFITILATAMILTGCNEDMASNRSSSPYRPPIVTEPSGVFSGIHREKGTNPITYISEIKIDSTNVNLRRIPDMRLDDDGGDEVNVILLKIRPSNLCGFDPKMSMLEKIADCFAKNSAATTIWNGTLNAGSAESTWKLVMMAEKDGGSVNYEIWIDQRTGMLWSEIFSEDGNWCEASGSDLQLADNVGIDCGIAGKGRSLCTKNDLVELPKVSWRLPTRHDYLQADIDGIRFVLPRGSNTYWTATTSSDVTKRDKAWTYNMTTGTLVAELMNTTRHVRCIGTPNF